MITPSSHPGELAANQDIRAAIDHMAGATAVHIQVTQTVGLQVIDDHGLAAGHCHPGVGSATLRVNPMVAHAQCRPEVCHHVGRTGFRRANADVGTVRARRLVGIRRHQGTIAEPGLRLHCMLEIYHKMGASLYARLATGRSMSWH